jgi:Xaa-Pro aminopeptidase
MDPHLPAPDYGSRLQRLRQRLRSKRLDGLLVTHLPNLHYLTGFTGSSAVLALSRNETAFFCDGRYTEQAGSEVQTAKVSICKASCLVAATDWLGRRCRSIGFDSGHLSVSQWQHAGSKLRRGKRLVPAAGLVEALRMIKDATEMAWLREAVLLGSKLFSEVLPQLRPGIREDHLAAEIQYRAQKFGARGMAFETIVAGGPRSALPHGRATSQPLPATGFVVLDFGVILAGYCSDMTRTVHLGKPQPASRRVYDAVLAAQQAAVAAVKPGAAAGEIDRAARSRLERDGLGKYFTHSTGHGVGLEIHEAPRLAKGQRLRLQPGMVITIEPGVYIPGEGGVRIEDMVLVTARGHELLTPTPKELLVI